MIEQSDNRDGYTFTPLENPHMRQKIRTSPLPPGHWVVAGFLVLVAVAYTVSCLFEIVTLRDDISVIERVAAGVNVSTNELLAVLDRGQHVAQTNSLLLLLTLALIFGWRAFLQNRLGRDRSSHFMKGRPSWIALRTGILVALVISLVFVHKPSAGSDPSAYVALDHRLIWFMGLRIVVGALYIWTAIDLAWVSAKAFHSAVAPAPVAASIEPMVTD
jgi:hypothetical protein